MRCKLTLAFLCIVLARSAWAGGETRIVGQAPGSDPAVPLLIRGIGSSREVAMGVIPKGAAVEVLGWVCTKGEGLFAWPYLRVVHGEREGFVAARSTDLAVTMPVGDQAACRRWMSARGIVEYRR